MGKTWLAMIHFISKGTPGNEQSIKLTTTADYFNNTVPVVNGAIVRITDSNNIIFNFFYFTNTIQCCQGRLV